MTLESLSVIIASATTTLSALVGGAYWIGARLAAQDKALEWLMRSASRAEVRTGSDPPRHRPKLTTLSED